MSVTPPLAYCDHGYCETEHCRTCEICGECVHCDPSLIETALNAALAALVGMTAAEFGPVRQRRGGRGSNRDFSKCGTTESALQRTTPESVSDCAVLRPPTARERRNMSAASIDDRCWICGAKHGEPHVRECVKDITRPAGDKE